MYRVVEIPLQAKAPLVGKLVTFLFGNIMPRFHSRPLHFEIETTLNQMVQQGYFLLSQSVKAGKKGSSETILLIFANVDMEPEHSAIPSSEWDIFKANESDQ